MFQHLHKLDVRPQLPASPTAFGVLLGDLLGLLVLIVWGLYSHQTLAWKVPRHTLETLAPFVIAWLVLAPLVGLYHRQTLREYRQTLGVLVVGWSIIAIVAALIRASPFFDGGASPIFVLVNAAFGLLILLPWRVAVVAGLRQREQ
jgi:hypothetical protein